MGVLTDPKKREKLIKAIRNYNHILCILLYVGGSIGFLALAYTPFNAGSYFSENALLPGLVQNEFYLDSEVKGYNDQIKKEMKKSEKSVPKEWLFKKFQDLGLETYYQNFSLQYPFGMPKDKAIPGQNIYSILRAKRASSTEALVLSVPLRHYGVLADEQTSGGIAVMLALAKHFRKQTYWAKDIIFLLSEFDEIGMQAWLDGYHQTQSNYITSEDLPARSGPIQAAINLEIPSQKIHSFNIKLEGLNGQLPNLDLSNLVVRLCRKERASVTLNKQIDAYDQESFEGYRQSLTTMFYMMWNQASGSPTGNHGLFHRFHIEALTVQGVSNKRLGRTIGLDSTSRMVEGIFRSLNNLLERFHQSFFFYIQPATNRYVSIGLYMPPFGAMIAACLIKAIALWIGAEKNDEVNKDEKKETSKDKSGGDTNDDDDDDGQDDEDERNDSKSDGEDENDDKELSGVESLIPVIGISILMAVLSYIGPLLLTSTSSPVRLRPEDALIFGLLALFCASVAFPKMFNKKNQDQVSVYLDWQLLKCVALIVLSLTLFSIALMNISLAYFIGVIMVPVTTFIQPTKSRVLRFIQRVLLLLVSPVSLILLSAVISTSLDTYSSTSDFISMTWTNMKQSLFMKVLDHYLFGNWTYSVFSFVIYPCWLLFWAIPNCTTALDKK